MIDIITLDQMDHNIITAVRVLSSKKRLNRPVYPRDIYDYHTEFDTWAAEGTIRRKMARLADGGHIVRVGDCKNKYTRQGYYVPDWRK